MYEPFCYLCSAELPDDQCGLCHNWICERHRAKTDSFEHEIVCVRCDERFDRDDFEEFDF